ncbi:hypothetical protein BgiBS90_006975 [Biomphalaria glabrata]|nr:hypothetical protein BgiBS90_006975 [Biomphalaria glabrata]
MGNKLDKMVSQLKEGVDSLVKEQLPVDSLVKKLRGQDCGCTNSGDGDAGDLSAVCVCVVGKSCGCDFQDEKHECQSNHSKSELSRERHFPLEHEETYLLDVRLLSEDDFGALDFACNVAASEPEAPLRGVCREGLLRQRVRSTAVLKKTVLDPISLCGKRPRHYRNNSLVNWRKRKRHWKKTMRICTSTIIIDIGIDECQSNHSKSELSRERHFPLEHEETYLLDVRLLSEDDFGALDFACNVAASEPEAPLRGVCREGLLRQRVRSTAVLKKTVLDPISLCGKRPLDMALPHVRSGVTEVTLAPCKDWGHLLDALNLIVLEVNFAPKQITLLKYR